MEQIKQPQFEYATPQVKLMRITPDAEKVMAYEARVSNPNRDVNMPADKLLAYCAKNGHWSVFEMANISFEVETTRAITAQILRHRSNSFQERSQRYMEIQEVIPSEARLQDQTDRQNSIDIDDQELQEWWSNAQDEVYNMIFTAYNMAINKGIAKEVARGLLPMNTKSLIAINFTIRGLIHYLDVRAFGIGTQKEHRQIALEIAEKASQELPIIAKALNWENKIQEAKKL